MKKIKYLLSVLLFFLLFVPIVSATGDTDSVSTKILKDITNKSFGVDTADVADQSTQTALLFIKIGEAVQIVLRVTGVLLLLVILYAGFLWLTAGGNDGQVDTAKKWVSNGVIGLILVSIANVLTGFIMSLAL